MKYTLPERNEIIDELYYLRRLHGKALLSTLDQSTAYLAKQLKELEQEHEQWSNS